MVIEDDDDPPEPIQCRICGTVDAPHDDCPYASNEQMSQEDELAVIALMQSYPLKAWDLGEKRHQFTDEEYKLGEYTVSVFFDGVGVDAWDYVNWVEKDGKRYQSWPQAGELALPARIAYWSPEWPRPSFVQMLGKLLGEM